MKYCSNCVYCGYQSGEYYCKKDHTDLEKDDTTASNCPCYSEEE